MTVDGSCQSSRHHESWKIDSKVNCSHFSFLHLSSQVHLKLGWMFAGRAQFPATRPVADSPNCQPCTVASRDLAPALQWLFEGLSFLLAEVITQDVARGQSQLTHLPQARRTLTTGLGRVNGFMSCYKGTRSSPSYTPHHLSGGLRDSNDTVINILTFSVSLPPVQISITHSDKEKMKPQSVRLQVFSSVLGLSLKRYNDTNPAR